MIKKCEVVKDTNIFDSRSETHISHGGQFAATIAWNQCYKTDIPLSLYDVTQSQLHSTHIATNTPRYYKQPTFAAMMAFSPDCQKLFVLLKVQCEDWGELRLTEHSCPGLELVYQWQPMALQDVDYYVLNEECM